MKKKCTRFANYFIFSDEKLNEHITSCTECREFKAKFDKVSSLVQEAKPLYFKRQKIYKKFKIAASILFLFAAGIFIGMNNLYNLPYEYATDTNEALCAEDLGFPVDSYGLILVDE